jgi:hypothetical protein
VHHAYESAVEILADPISYQEAIQSEDCEKWEGAMEEEFQAHIKNGTWELVKRPVGVNVIPSRWVFKTKRDENGNVVKYKGRGVAKGCSQKEGRETMGKRMHLQRSRHQFEQLSLWPECMIGNLRTWTLTQPFSMRMSMKTFTCGS